MTGGVTSCDFVKLNYSLESEFNQYIRKKDSSQMLKMSEKPSKKLSAGNSVNI